MDSLGAALVCRPLHARGTAATQWTPGRPTLEKMVSRQLQPLAHEVLFVSRPARAPRLSAR
jgi:hypothetical protein